MVGYPYTKYMISIMDVDMAAAVLVAATRRADALGVPPERRVYLRGWCYATDPVYVAEHAEMWRSPAMAAASGEAFRVAGVGIDDVAHLDLYSCFGSSVNFARDALGIARRRFAAADRHRRAAVPRRRGQQLHDALDRDDGGRPARATPARYGLVSGVGMHMTKHVYGVYSTEPGPVAPPEQARVQREPRRRGAASDRDAHDGDATVAAYSVVHGRDGEPEWAVSSSATCPTAGVPTARCSTLTCWRSIERDELVGARSA